MLYRSRLLNNFKEIIRNFDPRPLTIFHPEERFQCPYQKIEIEVGAGNGRRAILAAKQSPNTAIIALEKTSQKFRAFQSRLSHHEKMENLFPFHTNAISWIASQIKENSIDQYSFFYPNPYPKPSARKKRWHMMPFFGWVIKTLKPGGKITFASNEAFYRDESQEYLKNVWQLNLVYSKYIGQEPLLARTSFESKFLTSKIACFEWCFEKPNVN